MIKRHNKYFVDVSVLRKSFDPNIDKQPGSVMTFVDFEVDDKKDAMFYHQQIIETSINAVRQQMGVKIYPESAVVKGIYLIDSSPIVSKK